MTNTCVKLFTSKKTSGHSWKSAARVYTEHTHTPGIHIASILSIDQTDNFTEGYSSRFAKNIYLQRHMGPSVMTSGHPLGAFI